MDNIIENIICYFFQVQCNIKINHYQTLKFSRHKATDALLDKLLDLSDKFVEVYIGKNNLNSNGISDINITMTAQTMPENDVKQYLKNQIEVLRRIRGKSSTELQNIIDNMIANINQSLYLLNLE